MYKRPVYIFSALAGSLILAAAAVMFVPPVGQWLVREAAAHFLGHRLHITSWRLGPTRFRFEGVFDDNSTVELDAFNLLSGERSAILRMNADATLFSQITGTPLPRLPFQAQARYRGERVRLEAALLGGTLAADMNLSSLRYRYRLNRVSVERYLADRHLPPYASGELTAEGNGSAVFPFPQKINLISNNFKLQKPLTEAAGLASLPDVLDLNLSDTFRFDTRQGIRTSFRIDSALFSFSGDDLRYQVPTGAFTTPLTFVNRGVEEIPLRNVTAVGIGNIDADTVSGNYIVTADDYLLILDRLDYRFDAAEADGRFRFSTLSETPVNLTGANALKGSFHIKRNELEAKLGTSSMPEPLRIVGKGSRLSVISNNIPVQALFSVVNRETLFEGTVGLEGRIDLNTTPPAVDFRLRSDGLRPNRDMPLARELNLTGPVALDLRVHSDRALYLASLDIDSQILRTGNTTLRYDASTKKAHLKSRLTDIALPGFHSRRLVLNARADFNRSLLTDVSLSGEHETFSLPSFRFGEETGGDFSWRVGRLDRFFPDADASAVFEGTGSVGRRGKAVAAVLKTNLLGKIDIAVENNATALTASGLRLQRLSVLLGRPVPVSGTLALDARLDRRSALLTLHSKQLHPREPLRGVLRPFPLDVRVDLARCGKRFFGRTTLGTGPDTVRFDSVDLDLHRRVVSGSWSLHVADLARSAVVFPDALADRLALEGDLKADADAQFFSLRSTEMFLSEKIHRTLDANASGPLPLAVDLNATRRDSRLSLRADIDSEPAALHRLHLYHDAAASRLTLESDIRLNRRPKEVGLSVSGRFDGNGTFDRASVIARTATAELNISNLYANAADRDFHADVSLTLEPLSPQSGVQEKATVTGRFRTRPSPKAVMETTSFGGPFVVRFDENNLMASVRDLDVHRLANFVTETPLLHRGRIDGDIRLGSRALTENNLSALNGKIDLHLHDFLLKGIALDDYLATLRNAQDFSLFQGSFSELPIIRSIKNVPRDLLAESNLTTVIPVGRIDIDIHGGIATCVDCAAATDRFRVAFAGDVNLTSRRFGYFYFALLNPEGCPYFTQRIRGPLDRPQINIAESGIKVVGGAIVSVASNVTDAANWLTGTLYKITSKTGEVISYVPVAGSLTDQTLNAVSGSLHSATGTVSGCTPFYLGSVPHPGTKK